ncbi:MAG: flagellar assembly protein FliX [Pseudomonadota bacterium]
MKVSGSKGPGSGSSVRKKSASGGSGGFADAVRSLDAGSGAATAAGGVHGAGGVSALDALLALQQSGDALDSPKKRAVVRAETVLEYLDGIRDALLSGTLAAGQLQQLVGILDHKRDLLDDPALSGILDEIELRARVELAKLEVAGLV